MAKNQVISCRHPPTMAAHVAAVCKATINNCVTTSGYLLSDSTVSWGILSLGLLCVCFVPPQYGIMEG